MGEWLVGIFSVASSVLVTALIFLTKNWISERLRLSIAHEYASELERVRAELVAQQTEAAERLRASIAQQQAVQAAAIGSLTSTHIASHERRLAAIETVWSETVRLRQKTPPAGRRSLAPSISLVAAAVAPLRSWHVKPAAAYTKDVGQTRTLR